MRVGAVRAAFFVVSQYPLMVYAKKWANVCRFFPSSR
jgi:hypothetical protein